MWLAFGLQVRDARKLKRWSVRELAERAEISADMLYRVEAGEPASTDTATRLAAALGRRAELLLVDVRRKADSRPNLSGDPVHSAMGEFEVGHLRRLGYDVGIDVPYQHYQFAGRADVVAWDVDARALLHIENRTRFPDLQDAAGSFNAKRSYLGPAVAERAGVRGWASETHVIAALWSAEVLHTLRLRTESFRALCPGPPDSFAAWWRGEPPARGHQATLVVLDPVANGRQRAFIGLPDVPAARPRHRAYAEAARVVIGSAA